MGQYVKFEAKKIFKTLNILEESQLKYSGGRALRKLGFEMKKNVIPKQMKANFIIGHQAAPYTLGSIRYGIIDNNRLELTVNEDSGKGNAPANYLFPPMVAGGSAFTTRFTKALRAQNYISERTWAVPTPGTTAKKTPGWFYAQTLAGLANSDRRLGSSSPINLSKRANKKKTPRMGILKSVPVEKTGKERGLFKAAGGIYRVKGDRAKQLFYYVRQEPKVPKTYDYYRLATEEAQEIFPELWMKEIKAAIDRG
jgi:hypothetical protein